MTRKLLVTIIAILAFGTIPVLAQEPVTEVEVLPPMEKLNPNEEVTPEQTKGLYNILIINLPELNSPDGDFSQVIHVGKTYKNFRVYFNNTTDYPVKLNIYGPFKYSYDTTIPPHSAKTVTINDAYIGEYEIDLLTQDGYPLTGDFRVRISSYPM